MISLSVPSFVCTVRYYMFYIFIICILQRTRLYVHAGRCQSRAICIDVSYIYSYMLKVGGARDLHLQLEIRAGVAPSLQDHARSIPACTTACDKDTLSIFSALQTQFFCTDCIIKKIKLWFLLARSIRRNDFSTVWKTSLVAFEYYHYYKIWSKIKQIRIKRKKNSRNRVFPPWRIGKSIEIYFNSKIYKTY